MTDITVGRNPLSYAEAINEGLSLCMKADPNVYVMGQLVDTKAGIFGTTTGLVDDYPDRVYDMPVAEGLMHAMGIGMGLVGKRPVLCHQRIDFMAPGLDAIINWLGLWYFKTDGQKIPLTIRAVVGKGWGQAPQHSKNLAALLATIPGINIYCPTNPHDAKGMIIDAVTSDAPSIVIEHRSLFSMLQDVPEGLYKTRRTPRQLMSVPTYDNHLGLTVVACGDSVPLALKVFDNDHYREWVSLFDLRMIKPLGGEGFQMVRESARRTNTLLVIDSGWTEFGVSSEIVAQVMEGEGVDMHVEHIGYPQGYTPMSEANEAAFYPTEDIIREAADRMLSA